MGWGQPAIGVGKRVRHSSDNDNNSELTNTGDQSEDLGGTHFNKRARDVSPRKTSSMMTDFNQELQREEFNGEETNFYSNSSKPQTTKCSSQKVGCSSSDTQCSLETIQYSENIENVLMDDVESNEPGDDNPVFETDDKAKRNETKDQENLELNRSTSTTLSMSATLKGVRISCRKSSRIFTAFRGTRAPRNVFARKNNANKCIKTGNLSEMTVGDAEDEYDDCDMKDEGDDLSMASNEFPLPDVCRRVVPAIRPSYFPYVPPYMNFCLHDERVQTMPEAFRKHLKWRLSPITPIVVKKTVSNSGFRLLRKTVEWGGEWGKHMKISSFRSALKDYQKLNHLPATFQIGRKDRLWKNVHRFMTKFGKEEFGFVPRTYVLPQETKQLKAAWEASGTKGSPWIVKPPAAARGTGIRVVNKWSQVPKKKPVIVQMYIANPYLINDRKFDLRLYVLVTSFHPLKVYMYNDGLVRFAPVKYSTKSSTVGDRYMHLTNYSINRNCELYTQNEDADACHGHKWTLKTLWRYMEGQNVDTNILKLKVEEIVIKTLISAEDSITTASSSMPNRYNGYELFGFDIIFDSQLKPWLLEVNISPSLHSSSPLDLAVKGPLVQEVLNIVGFHLHPKMPPDMKKMLLKELDVELEQESPVFDKRIYCTYLSKEEKIKHQLFKAIFSHRNQYLQEVLEVLTPGDLRQLITAEDELSQCDGFTRIFPTLTSYSYFPFFETPRYFNILLDAWEQKYHENRIGGITRMIELCRRKIHLEVPAVFKNPTCGNPDVTAPPSKLEIHDVDDGGDKDEDEDEVLEEIVDCVSTSVGTGTANSENDGLSSSSSATSDISGSNSSLNTLNCHDEDRLSGSNSTSAPQVGEYIKGVCY